MLQSLILIFPQLLILFVFFFFQAEDGIRDHAQSRGLGDVYKRQMQTNADLWIKIRQILQSSPQLQLRQKANNQSVLKEMILLRKISTPSLNIFNRAIPCTCLLYTSDAADDMQCVDLGGRRIIKKKKKKKKRAMQQQKNK
eukprot:TRINITY_DN22837_c0_g1_i1.p1 TRINITY_DN22837_c0_g1~~TRINITY_DN22837_c0_g1_i1.p1  ORF type:complete len:141 (-),score=27.81 TRINITY_DN22837_c0_g1_i1:41-463(-)